MNISAFIITKNEQNNIARAVNSLKTITNDIIIVDSNSSDNTREIAESLGAKVYIQDWPGYKKQKAFAESLCSSDFVLCLDADEEITQELSDEINDFLLSPSDYDAFYIDFKIIHRFSKCNLLSKYYPSNKFIRLYNKNLWSYDSSNYSFHDTVEAKNSQAEQRIYQFKNQAMHYSGSSLEQLSNKANFYSSEQARELFQKEGRKVYLIRLLFEFPIAFLKAFFLRRYFLFGFGGFVDSMVFAFGRFLKIAKLYEMQMLNKKLCDKNTSEA
jgi:glycosyltransferase involved in cell wall biosynthesis